MNKSAIHISSIKREKLGENKPHDFIIKFNPSLDLKSDLKHYLALDRLSRRIPGIIFEAAIKITQ